ncbi:Acetamidase/formamidase [Arthrobacter subterraneus]|uniref:Acetamidase/formamidase n=1 Tax=Arthrobacter subterraneus TaxID=335973 RepID=A0A1G8GZM1_9MICC|nr:acetamidase/formamidase family protein [Arthrobacter subterraneus]SDH99794.1 Acetamidase/formamidase [Arthrobacter subterraneus]
MTLHHLEPGPETTVQVFSRDIPAALTVNPGDTVRVRSLDAWGHRQRQTFPGEVQPQLFADRKGHCLTGPIAVAGAQPGDMLAVTFASLTPDSWGFTNAGRKADELTRLLDVERGVPQWLLWEVDAERGIAINDLGQKVRLGPFLGVVGLPPAAHGEVTTTPPRADSGGNIDCRELTTGSTLYLPVTVPDALLCVGDGHAAQGDGEVGGTAIECGMTSELVLDLVANPPLRSIHAVTPTSRITFGFNADLNLATAEALKAMLTWMESLFGMDRTRALALASTVVDLRITQIANETWGVHAVLDHDAVG